METSIPATEGLCRLLSLPQEIRLQIWAHVLTTTKPFEVMREARFLFQINAAELQPQVLRLSRAIFDEAAPVLYGSNAFKLFFNQAARGSVRWQMFLHRIGEANAGHIKHIICVCDSSSMDDSVSLFATESRRISHVDLAKFKVTAWRHPDTFSTLGNLPTSIEPIAPEPSLQCWMDCVKETKDKDESIGVEELFQLYAAAFPKNAIQSN